MKQGYMELNKEKDTKGITIVFFIASVFFAISFYNWLKIGVAA